MLSRTGALLILACACAEAQPNPIHEASGVARAGEHLLVVDDAEVGAYFRIAIPKSGETLIELNRHQPERIRLSRAALAVDLESIDILADKRVALLSERLRSLVTRQGIIVEYDSQVSEVAKRGLEGLAIRPLASGDSMVAVLWEGGYPEPPAIPKLIRRPGAAVASQPIVIVHTVPRMGRVGRLRWGTGMQAIELQVPTPEGTEPEAQRFRAPDLAWYKLPEQRWGFLALLSSQSGLANPEFRYRWLMRFDGDGKPIGDPLDLAGYLPEALRLANWEGLGWFEPGKSVVLVHEAEGKIEPHAFLLELPQSWQFPNP
jgi:hypothetical protein